MEMGCLSSHGPQSFSGDTTPLLDLGRKLYWIEEYQFTVLFRYIKKKRGGCVAGRDQKVILYISLPQCSIKTT